MMKFKKLLAAAMTGAMMLGLAATAAPAVSVYAEGEAAAVSEYDVSIDYETFTATISKSSVRPTDAYIILEVLKDESASKVSATYAYRVEKLYENTTADSTEDAGDTETTALSGEESDTTEGTEDTETETTTSAVYGTVVDLSFLKATKDAYIRVRGNSEAAPSAIIKINAQAAKFKMKYTSGKASLVAALSLDGGTPTEKDLAAFEYRTLYGSVFQSLTDFEQAMEEIAGTTIVVRKAATDTAPASVEVKVKVSAAPKAPKVTVDYANGAIKLPKATEYEVIVGADVFTKEPDKWVAAGTKAISLTPLEILTNCGVTEDDQKVFLEGGFTVAVRTAATESKAASVVTFVTIPAARTLTNDAEKGTITVDENKTLTYTFDEKGTTLSATGASFLYSTDGTRWSTLKAGTQKIIKATTAKEITIKAAGDKKTEVWASADSVKITYVAPSDKDDSTGDDTTGDDTAVTVESVAVTIGDGSASVSTSVGTVDCTATVTGSEGVAQTVTWSVAALDGTDIASTINESGVLTVVYTDVTKTLVVTATSTVDTTKSGSAEVAIAAQ